jgi:hypothetical protein
MQPLEMLPWTLLGHATTVSGVPLAAFIVGTVTFFFLPQPTRPLFLANQKLANQPTRANQVG